MRKGSRRQWMEGQKFAVMQLDQSLTRQNDQLNGVPVFRHNKILGMVILLPRGRLEYWYGLHTER